MKKLILSLFILLFVNINIWANEEAVTDSLQCNLVVDIPEYNLGFSFGLSDLWAQEYTGADLLRIELLQSTITYPKHLCTIMDGSSVLSKNHNKMVKSIISSSKETALLPELPTSIIMEETISRTEDFTEFVETTVANNHFPLYVNNSMTWGHLQNIYDSFAILSERKSLIITATANGGNFNYTEPLKEKAANMLNVLLVGSMSYKGVVSDFSQRSPYVAILAPSEHQLAAYVDNKPKNFGQTSGAAPQVTAALAAFTAITGYSLNKIEALFLLRNTALKSFNSFDQPVENGIGVLNTYKIGKMAQRLKRLCLMRMRSQNQNAINSCVKKEIMNQNNYHFVVNTDIINAQKEFPECFAVNRILTNSSCKEKQQAFQEIRKEAFLTANPILLRGISCIYSTIGFDTNARYFDQLARFQDSSSPREEIREMIFDDSSFSNDEKLAIAINGNHYDLVADLLSTPSVNQNLSPSYFSKQFQMIDALIKSGKVDREIALYILSREAWQKYYQERLGVSEVTIYSIRRFLLGFI